AGRLRSEGHGRSGPTDAAQRLRPHIPGDCCKRSFRAGLTKPTAGQDRVHIPQPRPPFVLKVPRFSPSVVRRRPELPGRVVYHNLALGWAQMASLKGRVFPGTAPTWTSTR